MPKFLLCFNEAEIENSEIVYYRCGVCRKCTRDLIGDGTEGENLGPLTKDCKLMFHILS